MDEGDRRHRPLSCEEDRRGVSRPEVGWAVWRELLRLGYVRRVLECDPAIDQTAFAAVLAAAPALLLSDSASGHPDAVSVRSWRDRIRGLARFRQHTGTALSDVDEQHS